MEVLKTTDLELLKKFLDPNCKSAISDRLRLSQLESTRSIFVGGAIVAFSSLEGKNLTVSIEQKFLYLPELDNILSEAGYFMLPNIKSSSYIRYSSYVPNGYQWQYSFPDLIWKAWASSLEAENSLLYFEKDQWLPITDISYHRSSYFISLNDNIITVNSQDKVMWGNIQPAHSVRIWSEQTQSFAIVPFTSSKKIPNKLEIENNGAILVEDFWRVVNGYHHTLENLTMEHNGLKKKYANSKKSFTKLLKEIESLKQTHLRLEQEITYLKEYSTEQVKKLDACLNSPKRSPRQPFLSKNRNN